MKFTRKGKEVTYIHYGHTAFNPDEFGEVCNERGWIKPTGGLWASPVNAERGWKDWCEDECFRECTEDNSFKFTMRDPSRIFYIDSEEALKEFAERYGKSYWQIYGIARHDKSISSVDFEQMLRDGWDALEISLSDYEALYRALYGWDCDSIVVLNKDAVMVLEEVPA